MGRSYNVIQAAAYIGCDPKTVRRMLKRGQLTAERTERGWLAIPGGQVEYAKIKWEEEQAKFARPEQHKDSPDKATRDAMDSIRRLEGRIASLEQIIAAQNERIASLEETMSNASLYVPRPPILSLTTEATPLIPEPQKSIIEPSSDMLSARDFATKIGMEYTVLDGYIRRGIRGDKMDVTEVPTTRKGYSNKFFSLEQQHKAIELLRKHGKL